MFIRTLFGLLLLRSVSSQCFSEPTFDGYVIGSGDSTEGSSRTVSCASGYAGNPGPITCQSDGLWTLTSGCSPTSSGSCPTSPVQDGYVIASGSSSAGSTRTVSCAAGFTGAATSITCQSNFQWTLSSGCSGSSSGSCPSSPVFEGYVVASGSSTAGVVFARTFYVWGLLGKQMRV